MNHSVSTQVSSEIVKKNIVNLLFQLSSVTSNIMFCYSGKCITSINSNASLVVDSLNSPSCMSLRRKPEVMPPEVIPLHVNRACVNGSHVSIIQNECTELPRFRRSEHILCRKLESYQCLYVYKKVQLPCWPLRGQQVSQPEVNLRNVLSTAKES